MWMCVECGCVFNVQSYGDLVQYEVETLRDCEDIASCRRGDLCNCNCLISVLFISFLVCLSVCLLVCLLVCLFVCLFVCLSVCLSYMITDTDTDNILLEQDKMSTFR
jgi:hypothetical protein